jgi:hypothetical protein
MITYINSNNTTKYTALFRDAEDALVKKWLGEGKNPEDNDYFGPIIEDPETKERYYSNGISSLNTYFSWINDLLNISYLPKFDENNQIVQGEFVDFDGMRFSMLPIDEEVFAINANTRVIDVPKAFKDNGISVQGDEISEVVYFKVDRFYDATDLFNQDVMIEWIAPSGLKGYSVPTVKVLDDSTNFVIFGWALAGAITEKAGDVTFSVRFYKYDDDNNKIQYSLSTSTQKAKIQPSIGLDIPGLLGSEGHMDGYKVLGDEIKALIKERSENSNFGSNGDKAMVPELLFLKTDPDHKHAPYVVILAKNGDDVEATVSGCGYSTDAGAISYFWKKFDYFTGDRLQTEGDNKLVYRDAYQSLTIAKAEELIAEIPSMKLWTPVMVGGLLTGYQEITLDEAKAAKLEEVFRHDAECFFDGVGYYKLVIKNRKGRATEVLETDPIIVYPPNVPSEVTITPKAYLDGEETEKNIVVNHVINNVPDVDPAYTKVDPVKVGYRDASGAIVPKYTFDPANEDVAYEWFFTPLGETAATPYEGTAEDVLIPAEEGDYFCRLTGLLNGAESETIDSAKCRVTYNPARPVFTITGASIINGNNIAITNQPNLQMPDDIEGVNGGSYTIHIGKNAPMVLHYSLESMKGLADHQLTDTLTCQWYCYELLTSQDGSKSDPDVEDILKAVQGVYTPATRDTILWPSDKAIGDPIELAVADLKANEEGNVVIDSGFLPEKDGYYFCLITNKYNDKEDTISTPLASYDSTSDN